MLQKESQAMFNKNEQIKLETILQDARNRINTNGLSFDEFNMFLQNRGVAVILSKAPTIREAITVSLLQHVTGYFSLETKYEILSALQEDSSTMTVEKIIYLDIALSKACKIADQTFDLFPIIERIWKIINDHLETSLQLKCEVIDCGSNYKQIKPLLLLSPHKTTIQEVMKNTILWTNFWGYNSITFSSRRSLYSSAEEYGNALISDLISQQGFYRLNLEILRGMTEDIIKSRIEEIFQKHDKLNSISSLLNELGLYGIEDDAFLTLQLLNDLDEFENSPSFQFVLLSKIKPQYLFSLEEAAKYIIQEQISRRNDDLLKMAQKRFKIGEQKEQIQKEMEKLEEEMESHEKIMNELIDKHLKIGRQDLNLENQIRSKRNQMDVNKRKIEEIMSKKKANQFLINLHDWIPNYDILCISKTLRSKLASLNNAQQLSQFIKNDLKIPDQHSCLELLTLDELNGFASIVNQLLSDPAIKTASTNDDIIEVSGRFLLCSQICDQIVIKPNVREIRFVASQSIYIDRDISKQNFHGVNIVFRAPTIEVIGSRLIDTSGVDGVVHSQPSAADGSGEGRSGMDGLDGNDGENSGNVYINCSQLSRIEQLSIYCNGGNGSKGQNGGKGVDGSIGYDGKDGCASKPNDGYYSYSSGSKGVSGGSGGNGGNAGCGGVGGQNGCVTIKCQGQNISNRLRALQLQLGMFGSNGRCGKGGIGGKGGMHGLDHQWGKERTCWGRFATLSTEWVSRKGNYTPVYSKNIFGWTLSCELQPDHNDPGRRTTAANGIHGSDGTVAIQRMRSTQRSTAINTAEIEQKFNQVLCLHGNCSDSVAFTNRSHQLSQEAQNLKNANTSMSSEQERLRVERERLASENLAAAEQRNLNQKQQEKCQEDIQQRSTQSENLTTKEKELKKKQDEKDALYQAEIAAKQKALADIEKMFQEKRKQKIVREQKTTRISGFSGSNVDLESEESKVKSSSSINFNMEETSLTDHNIEKEMSQFLVEVSQHDRKLGEALQIGLNTIWRIGNNCNDGCVSEFVQQFLSSLAQRFKENTNSVVFTAQYFRESLPTDIFVTCRIPNIDVDGLDFKRYQNLLEGLCSIFSFVDRSMLMNLMELFNKLISNITPNKMLKLLFKLRCHEFTEDQLQKVRTEIKSLYEKIYLANPNNKVSKDNHPKLHHGRLLVCHVQNLLCQNVKQRFLREYKRIQNVSNTKEDDQDLKILSKIESTCEDLRLVMPEIALSKALEVFLEELQKNSQSQTQDNSKEVFWEKFILRLTTSCDDQLGVQWIKKELNQLQASFFKSNKQGNSKSEDNSATLQQLKLIFFLSGHISFETPKELDELRNKVFHSMAMIKDDKEVFPLLLKINKSLDNIYKTKLQNPALLSIRKVISGVANLDHRQRMANAVNILTLITESPFNDMNFSARVKFYSDLFKKDYPSSSRESEPSTASDQRLCVKLEQGVRRRRGTDNNVEIMLMTAISHFVNRQQLDSNTDIESREQILKQLQHSCFILHTRDISIQSLASLETILGTFLSDCKFGLRNDLHSFYIKRMWELSANAYKKLLQGKFQDEWKSCNEKRANVIESKSKILEFCSNIFENSSEVWNPEEMLKLVELRLESLIQRFEYDRQNPDEMMKRVEKEITEKKRAFFKSNTIKNLLETVSKAVETEQETVIPRKSKLVGDSDATRTILNFLSGLASLETLNITDLDIEKVEKALTLSFPEFLTTHIPNQFPLGLQQSQQESTLDNTSNPEFYFKDVDITKLEKFIDVLQKKRIYLLEEKQFPEELRRNLEIWLCILTFVQTKDAEHLLDTLREISKIEKIDFESKSEMVFETCMNELDELLSSRDLLIKNGVRVESVRKFVERTISQFKDINKKSWTELVKDNRDLVFQTWAEQSLEVLKMFKTNTTSNISVSERVLGSSLIIRMSDSICRLQPRNMNSELELFLRHLLKLFCLIQDPSIMDICSIYRNIETFNKNALQLSDKNVSRIIIDINKELLDTLQRSIFRRVRKIKGTRFATKISTMCSIVAKTAGSIFFTKDKDNTSQFTFMFSFFESVVKRLDLMIITGDKSKMTEADCSRLLEMDCRKLLSQQLFDSHDIRSWNYMVQAIQESSKIEKISKLSVLLGIILLSNKFLNVLRPNEKQFLEQLIDQGATVSWDASDQQQLAFNGLIAELFSSTGNSIKSLELQNQNRILKIILENVSNPWEIGFLSDSEQLYFDKISEIGHFSSEKITNLLINSFPTEWTFKLKTMALGTIFQKLASASISRLSFLERNICTAEIKRQLRAFISHSSQDDDEYKSLVKMVSKLPSKSINNTDTGTGKYNAEIEELKSTIHEIHSLKYFFNRSNFFFNKENQEEHWFELLNQIISRSQRQPLTLERLSHLLKHSVDLKISQLVNIVSARVPENWIKVMTISLLEDNFDKLLKKKDAVNTHQNKKMLQKWKSYIDKIAEVEIKTEKSLLLIITDKIQTELQLTDIQSISDPQFVLDIIQKISTIDFGSSELPQRLFVKLKNLPFTHWHLVLEEKALLEKYKNSAIVEAMLAASQKVNIKLIKWFVDLYFNAFVETEFDLLLRWLDEFYRETLILDDIVKKTLPRNEKSLWGKILSDHTKKVQGSIRSRGELIRLLKQDSRNVTINHLLEPEEINENKLEKILKGIDAFLSKPSKLLTSQKKCIKDWKSGDIKEWALTFKQKNSKQERRKCVEENEIEVLAVISQAVFLWKFRPRDIQMIAVILLLDSSNGEKGRLAQIATGEGKTMITAILAIIKALCGQNVDIVTSSPVLAVENAKEMFSLFQMFGVSVNNNCDADCENDEKLRAARYQFTVLYGDVSSFQRDQLLTRFFSKDITKNRVAETVIIDEVDSMLLDKGENVLYLSHALHDLKFLRPIYVEIWQAIHAPDVCAGRKSDMAAVEVFIKERMQRKEIQCPNYLKGFFHRRLPLWIRNAFLAERICENDPYILADTAESGRHVVIMDKDTGVEQTQMHWSNGLHQFLQLKHMDKLSSESLKAVFISNLSYFKQFSGNLYGITGTLGSDAESALLSQCYNVDFFTLPRFKARRCTSDPGTVAHTEFSWLDKILKVVLEKVSENKKNQKQRAVLIIAENVDSVDKISNKLNGSMKDAEISIYSYKSAFDKKFHGMFANGKVQCGQVIVATNLAGRGTDLKISPELEAAGGIHVILSYMPSNVRIEEQAFGRTARMGQPGSVEFIIHSSQEKISIPQLIQLRDEKESKRLENFRAQSLQKIEMEEKLCREFTKLFHDVKTALNPGKKSKSDKFYETFGIDFRGHDNYQSISKYAELQLEFLKNRWALWLDSIGENLKMLHLAGAEPILESFEVFRNEILQMSAKSGSFNVMFAQGSTDLIKLGRFFECIDLHQKAKNCFDLVIKNEPNFCEIAHYYKSSCFLKIDGSNRRDAMNELKKCRNKIQERMTILETSIEILKITDDIRRGLGKSSLANRYEIQVQNEFKILTTMCGSIDEAVGSSVGKDLFSGSKGVVDSEHSEKIFNHLIDNTSIFKNYRVNRKIKIVDEKIQLNKTGNLSEVQIPKGLNYCKSGILRVLRDKMSPGGEMKQDVFLEVVLTQEGLWKLMKQHGLIENETLEKILYFVNYDKENFENLELSSNLHMFKDPLGRLLEEHNFEMFNFELCNCLKISEEEFTKIHVLLENNKLLQKKSTQQANVKVEGGLKYDRESKKLLGMPQALEHCRTILESILVNPETFDIEKEIWRHEMPLLTEKLEASKQIWGFLVSAEVVKNCMVDFPFYSQKSCIEYRTETIRKTLEGDDALKRFWKEFHEPVSAECDEKIKEHLESLQDTILRASGSLKTNPTVSVSYRDLERFFDKDEYPPELDEYKEMVFADVLTLEEKKSWWNWGAFWVAMLGLVQIVAGALLAYFSGGLCAQLGFTLIAEGVGDIFFAVETGLFRRNFSWKAYAQHKLLSVSISIVTFGIGAYFSRGAEAASNILKGMKLVKLMATTIVKKLVQKAGYAAVNYGIEVTLDKVREQILEFCETKLREAYDFVCVQQLTSLDKAMDEIYEASYEKNQAETQIGQALETVLSRLYSTSTGDFINSLVKEVVLTAFSEIQDHLRQKSGSDKVQALLQLINLLSQVNEFSKLLMSITELSKLCPKLLDEVAEELRHSAQNLRRQKLKKKEKESFREKKSNQEEFSKFKKDFKTTAKSKVLNELLTKLQHEYVQPYVTALAYGLLTQIQNWVLSRIQNIMKGIKKSCKEQGQRIAEFQEELSAKEKNTDGLDADGHCDDSVININDLHPETKVKDQDGNEKSISEMIDRYGDGTKVYMKEGEYHCQHPEYDEFLDGTTKLNKSSGNFHQEMYARKENCTIEEVDKDGNVLRRYNEGQEKTVRIMRTQNMDGTDHLSPIVNGKAVDIPQQGDTANSCLHQCFTFYNSLEKENNVEKAKKDASSSQRVEQTINEVLGFAKSDPGLRNLYECGDYDLSNAHLAGKTHGGRSYNNVPVFYSQSSISATLSSGVKLTEFEFDPKIGKIQLVEFHESGNHYFLSIDNRRLAWLDAHNIELTDNMVKVINPFDKIPEEERERFRNRKTNDLPLSYGNAVRNRVNNQNRKPAFIPETGVWLPGYRNSDITIKMPKSDYGAGDYDNLRNRFSPKFRVDKL